MINCDRMKQGQILKELPTGCRCNKCLLIINLVESTDSESCEVKRDWQMQMKLSLEFTCHFGLPKKCPLSPREAN